MPSIRTLSPFHAPAFICVAASLTLTGCSEPDPIWQATPQNENVQAFGLLRVHVHDAPIQVDGAEISAIELEVLEVAVRGQGGWETISDIPNKFNLLDLIDDTQLVLGDAVLAPGQYNELRLVLGTDNRIVVNGESLPLKTPSAQQSGLKIKGEFNVEANTILDLSLDFDAEASVKHTGKKWMLHPVIHLDGAKSSAGAFAAKKISGAEGGIVSLPDGASVEIPPGALETDTVISVEQRSQKAQGFTLSSVYELGPSGTTFKVPARVTLPYDEAAFPLGLPESEIEVLADFERLGHEAQDSNKNTITAVTSHFSGFWVVPTLDVDAALSDAGYTEWSHDGLTTYDHLNDTIPWFAAVLDLGRTDLRVRGVVAPVADAKGPGTADDVYELHDIKAIANKAGSHPLLAVNSVMWAPVVEDQTGTLNDTLRVGGVTLFQKPPPEVLLAISDSEATHQPTVVALNPGDVSQFATAFGSGTTVVWKGEFANSKGTPYGDWWKDFDPSLNVRHPRTAAGVDDMGRLVVLTIGGDVGIGGATLKGVYEKLRDLRVMYGVLLDGGGSPQLVLDDVLQPSLLRLVYYKMYEEFDGIRPVVSALVVETRNDSSPVVDDTNQAQYKLSGNPAYWYKNGQGYQGGSLYTDNMTTMEQEDNVAEVSFDIVEPGRYVVDAFIPPTHATTKKARYTVHHADGKSTVAGDQSGCFSGWLRLGEYQFNGGLQHIVTLTDVTGESYMSQEVGYDAFRVLRADNAEPPSCGSAASAGTLGGNDYRLPFPGGTSYVVTQGVGAHEYTSKAYWAIDFGLGNGDAVVASADGVVTEAIDAFSAGGCSSAYANTGNRVVVAHADGTSTLYLHLAPASVPDGVVKGAQVSQGQLIGRAGHTGYVCGSNGGDGTHLHFQRQERGGWYTQSVRTPFVELGGQDPKKGVFYKSQNN